MSDELQALCVHAGANSVFLGDQLLTTPNPGNDHDHALLERLDTTLAQSSSGVTRDTVSTIAAEIRPRSSSVEKVFQ